MLTFLAPVWSIGFLGAVGLPVAAHLLSRTRYLPADFPATRFVAQAALETTRINRPRHLLLLLLRILALAAVVAAFMQPRWQLEAAATTGQGRCVVIVIDISASMQRAERGASLFEQAVQRADAELAGLDPATDTAWVVLAGRSPRPLLPEPGGNLSELRARLQASACTYETGDLQGALRLAESALAEQDRAGKVLILSDGQATSRADGVLATRMPGVLQDELAFGPAAQGNIAVQLIDVAPFPPTAGLPTTLTVALRNFGDEAAPFALSAEGGGDSTEVSVTLAPGAVVTRSVALTPREPGGAVFRVRAVPGDAFAYDDEAGFFAEVREAQPVVVFTSAFEQDADSAVGRLGLALAPDDNTSRYTVAIADPGRLDEVAGDLDDPSACWVVCSATRFSEGLAEELRRHLDAGGGVLWIVDGPASLDALHDLPWAPLDLRAGTTSVGVVASARFDHPVLRVFEGPARASVVGLSLSGVSQASTREGAEVLLSTADGRVVLALARVGRGRFAVLNATLDPARTDVASQPVFVPLVNELVRHLAPGPVLPVALRPGDPLAAALQGPGTERPGQPFEGEPGVAQHPGAYVAVGATGALTAGQWVALDPAESDLKQADADASSGPAARVRSATYEAWDEQRDHVALWPYLVAGALLCVAAESLLLMGFARREARA
jgi:hypothetical protein